ncbi:hypothetical protein TNCV_1756361 [Trichonephila clavipes]|nr:hypothetical protein TNCV_1756361 [Trichonephila clavipes]
MCEDIWGYGPEKIYLECSLGKQSNPASAVDQGSIRFELLLVKPLLKPSQCLHNGKEADDWMGLDEWNNWLKSQVRDSNRSQDILNLNKKSLKQIKTIEEIAP